MQSCSVIPVVSTVHIITQFCSEETHMHSHTHTHIHTYTHIYTHTHPSPKHDGLPSVHSLLHVLGHLFLLTYQLIISHLMVEVSRDTDTLIITIHKKLAFLSLPNQQRCAYCMKYDWPTAFHILEAVSE